MATVPAPATPEPTTKMPVISNITAYFTTNWCTRAADGWMAMALVITFDYTDAAGDISGGRIPLRRSYNTGRSESHVYAVPSDVSVTGTPSSGEITIANACPLYDDGSSSVESVTLVDADGDASNSLSITVTRPAGDR